MNDIIQKIFFVTVAPGAKVTEGIDSGIERLQTFVLVLSGHNFRQSDVCTNEPEFELEVSFSEQVVSKIKWKRRAFLRTKCPCSNSLGPVQCQNAAA